MYAGWYRRFNCFANQAKYQSLLRKPIGNGVNYSRNDVETLELAAYDYGLLKGTGRWRLEAVGQKRFVAGETVTIEVSWDRVIAGLFVRLEDTDASLMFNGKEVVSEMLLFLENDEDGYDLVGLDNGVMTVLVSYPLSIQRVSFVSSQSNGYYILTNLALG